MENAPIPRLLPSVLGLLAAACSALGGGSRAFHQEAIWSPDGETLLVSRHDGEGYGIYSLGSDGSDLERLVDREEGREDCWASWSPDGRRFVFHSERGGKGEIYVARADGTVLDDLTRHAADDTTPAWSPEGLRIAFASDRTGAKRIHVMDARGLGQLCVSEGTGEEQNPVWSPDGKSLAFFETVEGVDWVVVMRADGTARRRLARGVFPAWSRDGRRILFDRDDTIRAISVQGGDETVVLTDAWCARVAPDGRRLSFLRGGWPASEVWVANSDGTAATRLVGRRSEDAP
jgi:dipeptidyl aminopeptidase/acylaminoacyl peptidase